MLIADILNNIFSISGQAARVNSYYDVDVSAFGYAPFSVTDNDAIGIDVPISDDGSIVKKIDARGVIGAGVDIDANLPDLKAIFGSEQDDSIWVFGGGARNLYGYSGDDYIQAGSLDTVLNGGRGNDELVGGVGNDTLVGNKGDDEVDGGGGVDTMEFFGNRGSVAQSL
ncbi:MAG: hypothetical protein ABJZ79_14810 [Parasphingorhabdus sp.]|uniref:calcium-binding protein n=1 Tax=Parasphingorhabdus sp. TaxID=2709688 RepID=UPI003297A800